MILIHPSSLGKIMTSPKKAGEVLSEGAKTYLRGLAKEHVYGYHPRLDLKVLEKGLRCEQDSIDLYNSVFFTAHYKNSTRVENDILSGEWDIEDEDTIKDIKTSWSLQTFPATQQDAHDSDYEWQLRGYMLLREKPFSELAFCLVSTPEDLCKWEDPALHCVDHIDPALRVTRVRYERDLSLEAKIVEKCKAAQKYVASMIETIKNEHSL